LRTARQDSCGNGAFVSGDNNLAGQVGTTDSRTELELPGSPFGAFILAADKIFPDEQF
jgi:hypothetical protein